MMDQNVGVLRVRNMLNKQKAPGRVGGFGIDSRHSAMRRKRDPASPLPDNDTSPRFPSPNLGSKEDDDVFTLHANSESLIISSREAAKEISQQEKNTSQIDLAIT